jgi:hypothetical protein
MPEEIWAAQSMLLPSIVAASFAMDSAAKRETIVAAFGAMMHCPFSYVLHMHRALFDDPVTRTKIFKFDASFIHIHALLTGYAWFLQVSWLETIFHVCCIINIARSDPLGFPKSKNLIDVLCAVGVIKSSFGLSYRSKELWVCALIFLGLGFAIHNRKLLGPSSAFGFHILLAIPQYCIMRGCQEHTNFYSSHN